MDTFTKDFFIQKGRKGGRNGWKDPKQRAKRLKQLAKARENIKPRARA